MNPTEVRQLGLELLRLGCVTEGRNLCRIADTLEVIAREDPVDDRVTTDAPPPEEPVDLVSQIKDESDTILTILRSVDATEDLRKQMRSLYDQTRSLQMTIRSIGSGLYEALGSEETKDLDQSAVGSLRAAFDQSSKDLDPILKYAGVLKSLESKVRDQDTLGPVQHKLPQKSPRELEKTTVKPERKR